MTWTELTQAVAAEFDLRIGTDEADTLLWNATGFPEFWQTNDPIMECSNQLRHAIRAGGHRRCRPLRAYSSRPT